MNIHDEAKAQMLALHCVEVARQRMLVEMVEAWGMVKGWNADLICEWKGHNEALIVLMKATRQLLPF